MERRSQQQRELQSVLNSVERLNIASLRPYAERFYNRSQEAIRRARDWLSRYQTTSAEDYLSDPNIDWLKHFATDFNEAKNCVQAIKNKNGQHIDWTSIQTHTPQDAYEEAKADMIGGCSAFLDASKINCFDDGCGTFLWQDDTVTCTYHDITVQYVFDDICDK